MIPDSIAHQFRKLQADGAIRTTGGTTTSSTTASTNNLNLPPPPAYTPSSNMHLPINNHIPGHDDGFTDDDTDGYDDEDDEGSPYYPTTSITVTAPVKVVGHGNILNTSSLTSMLSSSLTTALQQHQTQLQSQQDANTANDSSHKTDNGKRSNHQLRPALRPLHLNVNCAVSIIGSRNVVGESVAKAAVVARMMGLASTSPSATAGGAAASLPSFTTTTAATTTDNGTNAVVATRKRPAESVRRIFHSQTLSFNLSSNFRFNGTIQESTAEVEPPSKKLNTENKNHN